MRTITRQELDLVLANHLKWLNNENGSVNANLRGAILLLDEDTFQEPISDVDEGAL